jgi:AcrR family transcriptional regulator
MIAKEDYFLDREKIILKVLELLESTSWDNLTLTAIAQAMHQSPLHLYKNFATKGDLLCGIIDYIDIKMLRLYGEGEENITPKEALFDLLMCRFETLTPYRKAISSLYSSVLFSPCQVFDTYSAFLDSLRKILETSHISTEGILGMIKLKGFAIVYILIMKTWLEDRTEDLSKTMVTIDKLLKQIEPILTRF